MEGEALRLEFVEGQNEDACARQPPQEGVECAIELSLRQVGEDTACEDEVDGLLVVGEGPKVFDLKVDGGGLGVGN